MSRSGSGDVFALLQASAVFAGLPVPEVEALAATAREQSCRAREYVFHEGDPSLWLCLATSPRGTPGSGLLDPARISPR